MSLVDLSETESRVLGLKIGRCNCEDFDIEELFNSIVSGNYDICRLKLPASNEMVSYKLEKLGIPFYFSGSIRRYKTFIKGDVAADYLNSDLIFEEFDGSQNNLLRSMLAGTWGDYPIGYYRSPGLSELANKETELESVYQFYKQFNLKKNNPNNTIYFIKHLGEYVGFFSLNIVGVNLESHIGGILEPYRKGGYFLDKLKFIKNYCLKNKLDHFVFGARNENSEVQRIFQYVGFYPVGTENVFHIPSLLTHSIIAPKSFEVNISELDQGFDNWFNKIVHSFVPKGWEEYRVSNFSMVKIRPITAQTMNVHLSFPVLAESTLWMVVHIRSFQGDSCLIGYAKFSK